MRVWRIQIEHEVAGRDEADNELLWAGFTEQRVQFVTLTTQQTVVAQAINTHVFISCATEISTNANNL